MSESVAQLHHIFCAASCLGSHSPSLGSGLSWVLVSNVTFSRLFNWLATVMCTIALHLHKPCGKAGNESCIIDMQLCESQTDLAMPISHYMVRTQGDLCLLYGHLSVPEPSRDIAGQERFGTMTGVYYKEA